MGPLQVRPALISGARPVLNGGTQAHWLINDKFTLPKYLGMNCNIIGSLDEH
jgi:hypothetical protein